MSSRQSLATRDLIRALSACTFEISAYKPLGWIDLPGVEMTWGGVAPPGGKYTAPWAAPWIEFLVFLRQNAIINANTTGVGHEINQF